MAGKKSVPCGVDLGMPPTLQAPRQRLPISPHSPEIASFALYFGVFATQQGERELGEHNWSSEAY